MAGFRTSGPPGTGVYNSKTGVPGVGMHRLRKERVTTMSGRNFARIGAALLLAALTTSCAGPGTSLQNSWVDPAASQNKIAKVLIIGVAEKEGVRRQFEDSFAKRLGTAKVGAMSSYPMLSDPAAISDESVGPIVKEGGYSHILVTRLVDREKVTTYVPPTSTVYVGGYPGYYPSYYGGWGSYYGASYSSMSTPGYTYDTEYVVLETNIYDISSGKLVWSGITQSELGSKLNADIDGFIEVIVMEIKKDGLI
jgi:hypothetical protein